MKRQRIFLFILFVLTSFTAMLAQQVSVDVAMARAKAFMANGNGPRRANGIAVDTPELRLAYTQARPHDKKVCFYVFNYSDDSGFIIMGGDEAAKQVLAYSDSGSFDYDKAPEDFKWWLSQYEDEISYAMDNAANMMPRKASATSKTDISPLVQTTWSQSAPYSNAVNAAWKAQGGTTIFVTGCVATAMAQVMNFWECPTTGTGSHSYTCKTNTSFKPSANFGNTTYDWDNMLDSYSDSYTTNQANAVATLMYHAGVSVDMDYKTAAAGGSGASGNDIPYALATYFGYDKSVRHELRDYFASDEDWENMIYNELHAGRPVIYDGQSSSGGGHCFVCDGYKASDNTYHFNWGWGGYCDCYCAMTGTDAIKPGGSGTGGAGSEAAYNLSQGAVINAKKDESGLPTPTLVNNRGTITLKDGNNVITSYSHTYGQKKELTLTENVWNLSALLTTFTLGVKATDKVTGLKYYFSATSNGSLEQHYLKDYSITFNVNELPYNGKYTIQMVARNTNSSSNNDWYDIRCSSSVTLPEVTISGASDPEKTDLAFSISSNKVEVSRTVKISPDYRYDGTVSYTSGDESIATVNSDGVVTGVKEGAVKITAHGDGNTNFRETTQEFTVTVIAFQKEDVEASISTNVLCVGETAEITITDGYDGTPSYSSSNGSVATVENGVVTAVSAGDATITVKIPETSNYKGKTVTFEVSVTSDDVYLTETPYFNNDNNPWSGDPTLYFSIRNNSTSDKTVYFHMSLYTVTSTGETKVGAGKGFSISSFPASYTYSSSISITSYFTTLTEGQKYKLKFFRDSGWNTPYNIPYITFTYREQDNVNLTMSAAGYATLILPFNADIPTEDNDGKALDWKFYECPSLVGSTLELNEVNTIERNKPYIVSCSTGDIHVYGTKGC